MLLLLLSFLLYLSSIFLDLRLLVFVCFVPFFLQLYRSGGCKKAFFFGYVFGVVYFMFCLFWVISVSPAAWLAACLYESLFLGVFAFCFCRVQSVFGVVTAAVSAPFFWVTFEWLRSVGFLGMPAGVAGYYLADTLFAQTASVIGTYGLSFMIIAVNGLVALGIVKKNAWAVRLAAFLLASGIVAGAYLYGQARLKKPVEPAETLRVAVVQGNVQASKRWDPAFLETILMVHEEASLKAKAHQPDLMIWPETAIPAALFHPERLPLLERVRALVRDLKTPLLTGTQDFERAGAAMNKIFNAAVLFSEQGDVVDRYAKMHLFPFMEKSPFPAMTGFLRKRGFPALYNEGNRWTRFEINGHSFAVMICFESVFPERVRRLAEKTDFLVNLTNDSVAFGGWRFFYDWNAKMARLRSIELGRSMVRAANNGISFICDAKGNVIRQSEFSVRETVVAEVPLTRLATPYSQFGFLFIYLVLAVSVIFALNSLRRSGIMSA